VNLSVLEIMSEVAPSGFENDFICDILELIDELLAEGASRHEVARTVLLELRDFTDDDEVALTEKSFAYLSAYDRQDLQSGQPSPIHEVDSANLFFKISDWLGVSTSNHAERAHAINSHRKLLSLCDDYLREAAPQSTGLVCGLAPHPTPITFLYLLPTPRAPLTHWAGVFPTASALSDVMRKSTTAPASMVEFEGQWVFVVLDTSAGSSSTWANPLELLPQQTPAMYGGAGAGAWGIESQSPRPTAEGFNRIRDHARPEAAPRQCGDQVTRQEPADEIAFEPFDPF
jgi:hypothetical protein